MSIFFEYLNELFCESTQKVLLIFDIVGVALFFLPEFDDPISQNKTLIRLIGGVFS